MMKVLVVDGCKEDRRMVVEALLDLTNVVVYGAVADLQSALRALAVDPPDVIVTDAELPDGTVSELIAAAHHRQPPLAVAVFTGSDSDELRGSCRDADLFIPKDAGLHELQLGVRDLVFTRRHVRRELPGDPFRLLGRMTAGVAHDLNNYLTVVAMTLELLQRRDRDPDPELWARARSALDTSCQMTRNLITYARGGAPEPLPIDLSALARRTIGVVTRIVPMGILISLDLDDAPPPVLGVAAELEQVILNLVLNACDAMPRGGELRVSVRSRDGAIALSVEDTGGGIPDAPRLAHGTLSPSTKSGRAGAGLGLGIVRSVAERHRAAIRIAPREPGGTCVTVTFPQAA